MTQTLATFTTAPRDLDSLIKLGRFALRNLGQEVPAWDTDDERQAFLKLGTNEQAAAVLKALLERDKREKGGGKAATTTAAAAAAATTTAKTRTPSNKNSSAAAEPAAATSGGDVGGNAAAVLALLADIKSSQERLEEKVDELASGNAALQGQLAGNNKLVQVAVSLALQMSEQVLGAPISDVLQGAIDQLGDIESTLAEVVEGAAPDNNAGNE